MEKVYHTTSAAATTVPRIAKKRRDKALWDRLKRDRWLYVMLLPGILLTLVFKYIPMYGAIIAFKNYNPLLGSCAVRGWGGRTSRNSFPPRTSRPCC